jgi:hypothetical protein
MAQPSPLTFVRDHGVVLASENSSVPRLTELVVGRPVKGSWWSDPQGKEIFQALGKVTSSRNVLVCRLVGGKVTFVHRRLWPALVRASTTFTPTQLAQVRERHTTSGKHVTDIVAFPKWVPAKVLQQARKLTLERALEELRPAGVGA